MRAVQISEYGDPADVVKFVEVDEPPAPGAGEVLVEMDYAPINIADLLMIEGEFFHHPPLPALVGNEGVGRVLALGQGVTHLKVGDVVNPPWYSGSWAERVTVPAAELFPIETDNLQQASMVRTNPPTADLMLELFGDLRPGDWVVQNSANSGVGRWVIALAEARGVRTINLVRRPGLERELQEVGADIVLVDGPDVAAEVAEVVGDGRIALGLDGVSGEATARLANLLSPGGTVVSYAMMSGDMSAPADLRPLLFKGIRLEFFYVGDDRHREHVGRSLVKIAKLISEGRVEVPVAAVYPLSRVSEAIAHVRSGGKVLLDIRAA